MSQSVFLALETATESCSAALYVDGRISERSELAPRRHAELILPMIESLLVEADVSRRDIGGIAVGRGPGAFTGVRLAISVAQGLALGLDVPVVAVSSLEALALEAPAPAQNGAILAVIDARMGEIYAGAFRRNGEGLLDALSAESVGSAEKLLLPGEYRHWNVVGSGWTAYEKVLTARLPVPPDFADGGRFPQAKAVLRLATPKFLRGEGVTPEVALPVYLRDKVAMTLEEQHAAH